MTDIVSFEVVGKAETKGSARAFVSGTGRAIVTNDNPKEKHWAQLVREEALKACQGRKLWDGPVAVDLAVRLPRPKRCGKVALGVSSTTKPDIDKLARSILDALTGIVFVDDAQVYQLIITKTFANYLDPPSVTVEVRHAA